MKDFTKLEKNMGLEFIFEVMGVFMLGCGKRIELVGKGPILG